MSEIPLLSSPLLPHKVDLRPILHLLVQMLSRYVMMEICWLILRRRRRCAIDHRWMKTATRTATAISAESDGFWARQRQGRARANARVIRSIRPLLRCKRVAVRASTATSCSSSVRQTDHNNQQRQPICHLRSRNI